MNLLLITCDDLNHTIPGFMGGPEGLMPNLDRLAARSHRFVNNRTVAPICMPSRQAMLSGLVPQRSGGIGFMPIHEGLPTLTSSLKQAGYYVAAIHKLDHMQPQSAFPWDYGQHSENRNVALQAEGMKVAVMEARAEGKPFFLNCNFNDPHRPFYGSDEGLKLDQGNGEGFGIDMEVDPAALSLPAPLEDLPEVRAEYGQYLNSAQRLDIALGKLLDTMGELGCGQDTAVVFTPDHGMPFPFAKATCYEHGTRVPMLISWPGMGEPRTLDALTSNIDLFPTLLELLGLPVPAGLDGVSRLPLMTGADCALPEFQFTSVDAVANGMLYPSRAIQDGRYALIFSPWADGVLQRKIESMQGASFAAMARAAAVDPQIAARVKDYIYGIPLAFYDLHADPGQRHNLIGEPNHSARIERMQQALLAEMTRVADPQLDNFHALRGGRTPIVVQDPERYCAVGFKGRAGRLTP